MSSPAPAPLFRERLWPSPAGFVVGVVMGAMLGIIVFPVSPALVIVIGAIGVVAVLAFLLATSQRVEVTTTEFTAGSAHIAPEFLGAVEELPPAELRRLIGVDIDPTAYLCIRGSVPGGVRVEVADDEDPTPFWIVSSRRPGELAAALRGIAAGATAPRAGA